MANPFDDLPIIGQPATEQAPIEAPAESPFSSLPPATLGGDLPGQRANRDRATLAREAYARFRGAGGRRRFMAGARNIAGSLPFANVIPGVSEFATPQAGTQEAMDLEDYRSGSPTHSGIGSLFGRSAPYVAGGAVAPGLFATLPRSMGMGAVIEGGDASTRGDNPGLAALMGAVGAIPSAMVGRALTPRSRAMSQQELDAEAARRTSGQSRVMRDLDTLQPPGGPHGATPDEVESFIRRLSRRTDAETAEMFSPRNPIPPIPESGDRILDMLRGGAVGGAIGHLPGINNPMLGMALGSLVPEAARGGANISRRAIENLNRRYRGTPTGDALHAYFNNQLLSDANRALLQAIGIPVTQGGVAATGGQEIPTLRGN